MIKRYYIFRVGEYFRADVFGSRPIAKVVEIEPWRGRGRQDALITFMWEGSKPSTDRTHTLLRSEMNQAYSITGPIKKVPKLLGLVKVGE